MIKPFIAFDKGVILDVSLRFQKSKFLITKGHVYSEENFYFGTFSLHYRCKIVH